MNSLSCTIVLPCYNPQQNWAAHIIEQYNALTEGYGVPLSIILVNDGSTRGISQHDIKVLEEKIPSFILADNHVNKGKGYALRKGIALATTDIIIYTDIDFPYATESIASIYNALCADDCDIAIGVKDKNYYTKVPIVRRHISKLLRLFTGIIFSLPITDTQCGLKGFRVDAKNVFLATTIDRYLFDLEFIRKAHKQKFKLQAIEVRLNDNVVFRKMNYRLLMGEAINFIKLIFRRN